MSRRGSGLDRTATGRGRRVVIAGMGLLTPIGHSPWQTFSALLADRTLAERLGRLPDAAGPVDVARRVGAVSVVQHGPSDPAVELAERAARQALYEAGLDPAHVPVILASSKGAVGALMRAAGHFVNRPAARCYRGGRQGRREERPDVDPGTSPEIHRLKSGPLSADPEVVALGPHGYLGLQLRRRLGLQGQVHHVVAACASGLMAVDMARRRMLAPWADRPPHSVLVVATESALTPLFIHNYRRLGVLCPLTPHGYRAKPLAEDRCGFVLAEAAAAIVLRRVVCPEPGQIELLDTAVASDTHDLVRPSPRMQALNRVTRQLLTRRGIDLLHPHAPGTTGHDPAELSVFAPYSGQIRGLYACKGAVGHCLGAAGLVSLVVACLCARSGRRPAMPWLDRPILATRGLVDGSQTAGRPLQTHAIFASGFGGHVAGAVLATR